MSRTLQLTVCILLPFFSGVASAQEFTSEGSKFLAPAQPATKKSDFDLEQRRRDHWAWQPVRPQHPPSVRNPEWPLTPIDRFLLAKLEAMDLKPAPEADRRTLIRRLYFDLIGLPPSVREVEEFVSDELDRAYDRVVDRLLASPQFGERWARHWLDLVRYSETLGHEFDYSIPNAWRYRDYIIRSLNADVPYDQFIHEQIAGDLLPRPRLHATEGFNESIIATSFYWFGQQAHSPVDIRQHQADVVENQIDVLSKTFFGLTVACARCHDHKFDAISTRDYYALYGVLTSSRYAQRSIDLSQNRANLAHQLKALKSQIRQAAAERFASQAWEIDRYVLAAARIIAEPNRADAANSNSHAAETGLASGRLQQWVKALTAAGPSREARPSSGAGARNTPEVLPPRSVLDRPDASAAEDGLAPLKNGAINPDAPLVIADFRQSDFSGWFIDGDAFGEAPVRAGDFLLGDANKPIASILPNATAHSATLSRRLEGALRSPTFTIAKPYLHLRVAGVDSRFNICIDNFVLVQNPIYGALRHVLNHEALKWVTVDLAMWKGHRAYVEFSDIVTPDLAGGGKPKGYGLEGWIALEQIVASNSSQPPHLDSTSGPSGLTGPSFHSAEETAAAYKKYATDAVKTWGSFEEVNGRSPTNQLPESLSTGCKSTRSGDRSADSHVRAISSADVQRADVAGRAHSRFVDHSSPLALLSWLVEHGLLEPVDPNDTSNSVLNQLLSEYRAIEAMIQPAPRVPATADGTGLDEAVFIRGNPKNLGEPVARRYLEAIAGPNAAAFNQGSGRLQLAQSITDPANPLTARVMVNRVWHHLFGQGIVPTPDDFGVLGQAPSHPELLDWLAAQFRDELRWSTKSLIRLLVTSRTYRMSSRPSDRLAEEKDPSNLLWHRMPVKRLDGESIRDAILALSGRLDQSMFGPSVPVPLDEFMDGRGRPAKSGPLDGAGRRSIYIELRRNFLSPIMRAFDAPVPFTTCGRRTVSNVPAQSLILLNHPFVVAQTKLWANRLLANSGPQTADLVRELYLEVFSRPPSETDLREALSFLRKQSKAYGIDENANLRRTEVWADLCHVLLNVKEFVFVK